MDGRPLRHFRHAPGVSERATALTAPARRQTVKIPDYGSIPETQKGSGGGTVPGIIQPEHKFKYGSFRSGEKSAEGSGVEGSNSTTRSASNLLLGLTDAECRRERAVPALAERFGKGSLRAQISQRDSLTLLMVT